MSLWTAKFWDSQDPFGTCWLFMQRYFWIKANVIIYIALKSIHGVSYMVHAERTVVYLKSFNELITETEFEPRTFLLML